MIHIFSTNNCYILTYQHKGRLMIDNTRRNVMKLMALLGLSTVVGAATPAKLTLKQRKAQFNATHTRVGQGYYGFGETW